MNLYLVSIFCPVCGDLVPLCWPGGGAAETDQHPETGEPCPGSGLSVAGACALHRQIRAAESGRMSPAGGA